MQFFNVEKLFDFILICLFGWNGCASSLLLLLLLWLVNEHFCRGIERKSVWHSPDTCELMTPEWSRGWWKRSAQKINRLIYSPRRLMKHPQDTSNVFFVCLSNSQYLSKDYWLGVNWALLLSLPSIDARLHPTILDDIFHPLNCSNTKPPSPIKSPPQCAPSSP